MWVANKINVCFSENVEVRFHFIIFQINQFEPKTWEKARDNVSLNLPDIPNGTNCSVLVRAIPYEGGIWSSEAEIRFDPSAAIYGEYRAS